MTKPPRTRPGPSASAAKDGRRILPRTRYRHPGDVIRLIIAGLVLAAAFAATLAAPGALAGSGASTVTGLAPGAAKVLAGLVQVAFAVAAVTTIVVTLRHRRFRLLAGLAGGAAMAAVLLIGIMDLAGGAPPRAVAASTGRASWLISAGFPGPAFLAAAAAVKE